MLHYINTSLPIQAEHLELMGLQRLAIMNEGDAIKPTAHEELSVENTKEQHLEIEVKLETTEKHETNVVVKKLGARK